MSAEAVTARIQPVGSSKTSVPVAPGAPARRFSPRSVCSCHGTGYAAGARRWATPPAAPRLSQGAALPLPGPRYHQGSEAIAGIARSPDLTDDAAARAIAHMLGNRRAAA